MPAMPLPKLSVITPSLNQGTFLDGMAESVLAQDYPFLEWIIVDGGSTDGTRSVVERHADRVARFLCEPDESQSDAIRKGMALATGEVATWVNADDLLCPGALRAVGEAFAREPEVDVVYGDGLKVDVAGAPIRKVAAPECGPRFLRHAMTVLQPSVFFRKALYDRVGGLDLSLDYAMDWDLFLKFLEAGARFRRLDACLSQLRCHDRTKTNQGGWPRVAEIARVGKAHFGAFDRNHVLFRLKRLGARLPRSWPVRAGIDQALRSLLDHGGT